MRNFLVDWVSLLLIAIGRPVAPDTKRKRQRLPYRKRRASKRAFKIKQKAAMRFRTEQGAKVYTRIQRVIAAIRKLRLNFFQTLLAGNVKKSRIKLYLNNYKF
jgi:hypothetical protein